MHSKSEIILDVLKDWANGDDVGSQGSQWVKGLQVKDRENKKKT